MTSEYTSLKKISEIPRLPLDGNIDLTYRCNNNCRHCWVRISLGSAEAKSELTTQEIKDIIEDARKMGCRKWYISGGEPMLRPDFTEILDYIARKSVSYSLNTNGTLITPEIARILRKPGINMVALYGATAEVHDHITRSPGSFDATMQGFAYLKEAGADFIVQIVPMRDNYHQFKDMISLAESLDRHWRVGASWLYLSVCGDPERNQEIIRQRLDPKDVIELDKPDTSLVERMQTESHDYHYLDEDNRLFASCIDTRREFYIDPYGRMTFCSFIKDPSLLYDLRSGSFSECWEKFIPSLADKIKCEDEYIDNCGSCTFKKDCLWCPVYGYLEHGRYSAKVEYLCDVARENRKFKQDWQNMHRRYYQIAGITIQVESDLPIKDDTFHPRFKLFEVDEPGEDIVSIRHHFQLPDLRSKDMGKEYYRSSPWAIYKKDNSWIYLGISPDPESKHINKVAVFNNDHTRASIYNDGDESFNFENHGSLTLFSTDQILLARVLADRKGCYLHSSGVVFNDKGLLFVGHSEAGKSTMMKILKDKAEVLCDDRIIVRRWQDGFMIHGTWSHGEIPDVSPNSAPLKAILFLEKAQDNLLISVDDKKESVRRLLACLIKPFVTADWWDKTLSLIERMVHEVPCYMLHFDKSDRVIGLLERL